MLRASVARVFLCGDTAGNFGGKEFVRLIAG
jgi:hypothetical protein